MPRRNKSPRRPRPWQAGRTQNHGIDNDDIGHRQKRRDTREQLGANRSAMELETEEAIEH